jgi:hypothetical protein
MRVLYVCVSILAFALLAVAALGMTVSQYRPSMFASDDPYSVKTGTQLDHQLLERVLHRR